ncbi:hypothetical protein CV093_09880 [Oceanobacillus sp. 143]|nr:hypothetical protein CV093_09880 [Oceanobacillus sp. 143]
MLVPIIHGVDHLDRLDVDEATKFKVMNGQKLKAPKHTIETDPFLVVHQQHLLAIYQNHPDKPEEIKPVRVFNG